VEFANESHRQTYQLVSAYMTELFGESAKRNPDIPAFALFQGSAATHVYVTPLTEDHTVVRVLSWVVTKVQPSYELFAFLLHANHEFVYGGFSVDDENDIAFTISLYGHTLDKEELDWAVRAVAGSSDEYDDEIVNRFGGLKATDR
jgi:hypothetical protein